MLANVGAAMRNGFFGSVAAVIVALASSPVLAENCTGLSYDELVQRLRDVGFPFILLDKIHVDDAELRAQESFSECPRNSEKGETTYIYSWRPIEDSTRGLGVSFTFYEFASDKARQIALQRLIAADRKTQSAIKKADYSVTNKLESDVYFFIDPDSTKAIRVERDVEFVLG